MLTFSREHSGMAITLIEEYCWISRCGDLF
jgi:hypothetical protein